MRQLWILLFGLVVMSCTQKIPVDQIFYNGKIFTARTANDFVNALAIKNGKILAVGSRESIFNQYQAPDSQIVDLNGHLVVPGFHDAHLHFYGGAKIQREVNLAGLTSLDSVLTRIATAVKRTPEGGWVIGRGWDHELWEQKKLPNRKMLDRISIKHLIYLRRVDGHAAWVNTPVLKALRYNRFTPDPPGGKIQRDRYGNPTGILFDNAFALLDQLIPEPTETEKKLLIQQAIKDANALGITSITDNSPLDIYKIYHDLYQEGKLTLRVNFFVFYPDNWDTTMAYLNKIGTIPHFLHAPLIKLFADGSLGSRSALLLEPYKDDPTNQGIQMHPFQELLQMVEKAESHGFQVGIHAIGDSAVREVLDVFEALQQQHPQKRRWRIEHSQVVAPSDFLRYRDLNVIASMQPSHCISDLHWAEERIGQRARYAYAWKTFLDNHVILAFGTDWPVEPLNPMLGLYAAVARKDTTGYPQDGWYPEERLSMGQAIRAYTWGAAYAAGIDSWYGTLQPGREADFVVLSDDLFSIPPDKILNTTVLETYLSGKLIYKAGNLHQ